VILPVAGGTGLGAAAAAQAAGDTSIIWVDSDGYMTAPQYKSVFLTTVYKNISAAVEVAIKDSASGTFDPTNYVGTLKNEGVGLSPYHDLESKVPADLKAGVDKLKADIIAGTVKIESKVQPTG